MVVGTGMGRHWDGGGHWDGGRHWDAAGYRDAAGYQDFAGYQGGWVPRQWWVPQQMAARVDAGTGTSGHWDWWALGGRQQAPDSKRRRPWGRCQGSPGERDALGHPFPRFTWVRIAPLQPQLPESRYFVSPPAVPSPRGQPVPGWRHRAPWHPTACGHGEEQSCCARPCHELLRQVEASPWPRATRALPLPSHLGWVPAGGSDSSGFCQVTAGRGNLWNRHITWVPDSP